MSGTKRYGYLVGDWVRVLTNCELIIAVINYVETSHNVEYLITDKGRFSASEVIEMRRKLGI